MGRRVMVLTCIRSLATFLLGFVIGAVFKVMLTGSLQPSFTFTSTPLLNALGEEGHEDVPGEEFQVGEDKRGAKRQPSTLTPGNEEFPKGRPRVLCYVLVGPSTHRSAVHVKNTWGQRCDHLVFYSTEDDASLKPEILDVPEGYGYLWAKNKAALSHLYRQYPGYHWYLKADDDTYIIVENLRYFLQDCDPDAPVYYGVRFRRFVKQGYMSGGGGYVLSREALKRFVTKALPLTDPKKCASKSLKGSEDLQLGQCLESVGVVAGDSLDEAGLPRFFSHSPLSLFFKKPIINKLHWYWHYIWHPHPVGPDCCSPHIISFHGVDARMMWVLESLLYRIHIHRDLQPPGLNTSTSTPPPPSITSTHATHSPSFSSSSSSTSSIASSLTRLKSNYTRTE